MANAPSLILIAGATGAVGGRLARSLLTAGIPVRVTGRNAAKLAALEALGADVVSVDLRDRDGMMRACEGVAQVYSGVNNVLGHGTTSPNRVDLAAHNTLCDAAVASGVRRIVYLSARDMKADSPVDFFRVKHAIEERVQQSGLSYVLVRASAFMEIWVDMLADGVRKNGTAVLFGDGRSRVNFIAVEDVVAFSARILAQESLHNEVIDIGGPSELSFEELLQLLEQRMNVKAKRRHVPRAVLWAGGIVLKPFSEIGARLMRMGYFTATINQEFPEWRRAYERFGVTPTTIETFMQTYTPALANR